MREGSRVLVARLLVAVGACGAGSGEGLGGSSGRGGFGGTPPAGGAAGGFAGGSPTSTESGQVLVSDTPNGRYLIQTIAGPALFEGLGCDLPQGFPVTFSLPTANCGTNLVSANDREPPCLVFCEGPGYPGTVLVATSGNPLIVETPVGTLSFTPLLGSCSVVFVGDGVLFAEPPQTCGRTYFADMTTKQFCDVSCL